MKLELDDNVFWAVAIVCGTLTILGLVYGYNARAKSAFENGLVEGSVPGQSGVHWVKAEKK